MFTFDLDIAPPPPTRIIWVAAIGATALLVLLLTGCATGTRTNAKGQTEHQIVCGYALPWGACEQRAASLCPAGYDVVSKQWNALSGNEMWAKCR
jgi:hypothetical protein